MKILAAAALSLVILGCSSPDTGEIGFNCYAPLPVPDGALVYHCTATCECDPAPIESTLFAGSDGQALSCWEGELAATMPNTPLTYYACTWTGSVYHPSPGGKPNTTRPSLESGDGAFAGREPFDLDGEQHRTASTKRDAPRRGDEHDDRSCQIEDEVRVDAMGEHGW